MDTGLREVEDVCVGSKLANRSKLFELESRMFEMPQVEISVKHYKHGELYAREIVIPKDTMLTGKIHKFDHFDVMISGDISVSTDTDQTKRLTGYNLLTGTPGKKRAGYAHEETVWVTFHYYPFTDIDNDEIVRFLTAKNFAELDMFNEIKDKYIEEMT